MIGEMDMSFRPELGQALFGQPPQEFKCGHYVDAMLSRIADELQRVC